MLNKYNAAKLKRLIKKYVGAQIALSQSSSQPVEDWPIYEREAKQAKATLFNFIKSLRGP